MSLFLAFFSTLFFACSGDENNNPMPKQRLDSNLTNNEQVADTTVYDTVNVDGAVVRYKVASKRDTMEGHGPGIYCDLILPDYGPLSGKIVMGICKALGKKLQINFFYVFRNYAAYNCYYNMKDCPQVVSSKMGQDYLGEFVVTSGPPLKPFEMPKHKDEHHDGDGHDHDHKEKH